MAAARVYLECWHGEDPLPCRTLLTDFGQLPGALLRTLVAQSAQTHRDAWFGQDDLTEISPHTGSTPPRNGGTFVSTPVLSFKRLNLSATGNVVAGAAAATIYILIAVATGAPVGSSLGFGLLLGLFTFAVSFVVTLIISAARRHRAV
jgi:hypothetical protein